MALLNAARTFAKRRGDGDSVVTAPRYIHEVLYGSLAAIINADVERPRGGTQIQCV